jgi:putative transposase
MNSRNRTPSEYIGYGLYLYFLGLSFRSVAKALSFLHIVKRSHVSIWNWIQKYTPQKISSKKKKVSEYPCIQKDETIIKLVLNTYGFGSLSNQKIKKSLE